MLRHINCTGLPDKPVNVRVREVTDSSAILMWGTARNSQHVWYLVEKKVHGRWGKWTHTSFIGDHGKTKHMKVYKLKAGETHWFRIVARKGPHSTPSDPIRFQTKPGGKSSRLLCYLIIHMTTIECISAIGISDYWANILMDYGYG